VPAIQTALVQRYDPTLILVHSRWETYPVRRPDGVVVRPGTAAHLTYVRDQLRLTLQRLTSGQAHVVLIDSIPLADSLCRRLGHSLATCRAQLVDPLMTRYNALRRAVAAEFDGRVSVLGLPDLVCPGGRCTDSVAGRTPRPDGLHFSPEGAAWLAPQLVERALALRSVTVRAAKGSSSDGFFSTSGLR
jgi:lysophospholipase L1-like esterase